MAFHFWFRGFLLRERTILTIGAAIVTLPAWFIFTAISAFRNLPLEQPRSPEVCVVQSGSRRDWHSTRTASQEKRGVRLPDTKSWQKDSSKWSTHHSELPERLVLLSTLIGLPTTTGYRPRLARTSSHSSCEYRTSRAFAPLCSPTIPSSAIQSIIRDARP